MSSRLRSALDLPAVDEGPAPRSPRIPDGTSLLVTLKQAQPQQFTAARNNRVGVNVILDFL